MHDLFEKEYIKTYNVFIAKSRLTSEYSHTIPKTVLKNSNGDEWNLISKLMYNPPLKLKVVWGG